MSKVILQEDLDKYEKIFKACQPTKAGKLSQDKVDEVFGRSRLSHEVITCIKNLVHPRTNEDFDQEDFAIAMYYIKHCMTGMTELPGSVPPSVRKSASWRLAPADIDKHSQYFFEHAKENVVQAQDAVFYFGQSGLPTQDLAAIWDLSDSGGKGYLTDVEFAIANFLIEKRQNGARIPERLPDELVASASAALQYPSELKLRRDLQEIDRQEGLILEKMKALEFDLNQLRRLREKKHEMLAASESRPSPVSPGPRVPPPPPARTVSHHSRRKPPAPPPARRSSSRYSLAEASPEPQKNSDRAAVTNNAASIPSLPSLEQALVEGPSVVHHGFEETPQTTDPELSHHHISATSSTPVDEEKGKQGDPGLEQKESFHVENNQSIDKANPQDRVTLNSDPDLLILDDPPTAEDNNGHEKDGHHDLGESVQPAEHSKENTAPVLTQSPEEIATTPKGSSPVKDEAKHSSSLDAGPEATAKEPVGLAISEREGGHQNESISEQADNLDDVSTSDLQPELEKAESIEQQMELGKQANEEQALEHDKEEVIEQQQKHDDEATPGQRQGLLNDASVEKLLGQEDSGLPDQQHDQAKDTLESAAPTRTQEHQNGYVEPHGQEGPKEAKSTQENADATTAECNNDLGIKSQLNEASAANLRTAVPTAIIEGKDDVLDERDTSIVKDTPVVTESVEDEDAYKEHTTPKEEHATLKEEHDTASPQETSASADILYESQKDTLAPEQHIEAKENQPGPSTSEHSSAVDVGLMSAAIENSTENNESSAKLPEEVTAAKSTEDEDADPRLDQVVPDDGDFKNKVTSVTADPIENAHSEPEKETPTEDKEARGKNAKTSASSTSDHDFEVVDNVSSSSSFVSANMGNDEAVTEFDDALFADLSEATVVRASPLNSLHNPFKHNDAPEQPNNDPDVSESSSSSIRDKTDKGIFETPSSSTVQHQGFAGFPFSGKSNGPWAGAPPASTPFAEEKGTSPANHFAAFEDNAWPTNTPSSTTHSPAAPEAVLKREEPAATTTPPPPRTGPISTSDNGALDELVQMGFPSMKAEEALGRYDNDLQKAINYLVES